jgi:hypothetical protein
MYHPMIDRAKVAMEVWPEEGLRWPEATEPGPGDRPGRRWLCRLGQGLVRLGQRLQQWGTPPYASLPERRAG